MTTDFLIACIFFPVVLLVSLIGNLCTIYFNVHYRSFTSPVKPLTLNICASNVVISTLPTLFYLFEISMEHWVFGYFVCNGIVALEYAALASANITLVVLSYERWQCVKFPLQWKNKKTRLNYSYVALSWLIGMALAVGFVHLEGNVEVTTDGTLFCNTTWITSGHSRAGAFYYFLAMFLLIHLLPSLLIIVFYFQLVKHFLSHGNARPENTAAEPQGRNTRSRTVKTLTAIVLLFQVCWLPTYLQEIILLLRQDNLSHDVKSVISVIVATLGYTHSALHPIIYPLSSGSYRRCYKTLFKSICCLWRRARRITATQLSGDTVVATAASVSNP